MITIEEIKRRVKFYQDFPTKGINFIDLLPLLGNAESFKSIMELINEEVSTPNVAAPEARGFLFGAPLLLMGKVQNFIPFRKGGKLPSVGDDLLKVSIVKEYGDDSLYFRRSDVDAASTTSDVVEITIFDDVLATGGTSEGMAEMLESLQVDGKPVRVKEFVFLGEIEFLKGAERLSKIAPVKSLIKF